MKRLHLVMVALLIVIMAGAAWASLKGTVTTVPDGKGGQIPVPGWAPNGKKTVTLTGASVFINMTSSVAWKVYPSADCAFRTLTSATKVGPTAPIYGGVPYGEVTNLATPFLNATGCTGTLRR